jgi:hypothetical protein
LLTTGKLPQQSPTLVADPTVAAIRSPAERNFRR